MEYLGYSAAKGMGFGEETSHIVGGLLPAGLSLGLNIGGLLALRWGRAAPQVGALEVTKVTGVYDIPVLKYVAGELNATDEVSIRLHQILEGLEGVGFAEIRRLRDLVKAGTATAAQEARLELAYNRLCGNMAAAVDELIATGSIQPLAFGRRQSFIRNHTAMQAERGGEVVGIHGHKEFAQDHIIRELLAAGDNSQGIVLFLRVGPKVDGHFVNVVNIGGEVFFIDGILGGAVSGRHLSSFLKVWDGTGGNAILPEMGIRLILTRTAN